MMEDKVVCYDILLEQLRHSPQRVILIGAEAIVTMCHTVLNELQCEDIVICDNSLQKQGSILLGHEIISLQEAVAEKQEAMVFLCFLNRNNESVVRKQMQQLGVKNIYSKYPLIYAYYKYIQERNIDYEKFVHSIEVYEEHNVEEDLILENLCLEVTNRCSLKCRDCSMLIPYRTQHELYDVKEVIECLKKVSKNVDAIGNLHILGGEPFLLQNLPEICKEVSEIDNVHFIRIVTNGTIVPSEKVLDDLKKHVSYVAVSDYREFSTQKNHLKIECEKRGIPCEIREIGSKWYAMSEIGTIYRNEQESWKQFLRCDEYCKTPAIATNKMYPCCNLIAQESLGQEYIEGVDYINFNVGDVTRNLKIEIRNILDRKKNFISTCGACLYQFDCTVQSGIQM